MQGETREHWQDLCELAAVENDPDKLMTLVEEIICLLDEKYERTKRPRSAAA